MTPYEQGYYSFMKLAAEPSTSDQLIAGGGATGVGGAGTAYVAKRAPTPDSAALDRFRQFVDMEAPGAEAPPEQMRNFIRQYTERGHDLIANPTFKDMPMTGEEFITKLRNNPIASPGGVGWGPDQVRHYGAFAESPQAAFDVLMMESAHPRATAARSVDDLADDVLGTVANETAGKFNRYKRTMPHLIGAIENAPKLRRLGRAGALLGTGAAGAGLIGKALED